jgi:hypothetical protein
MTALPHVIWQARALLFSRQITTGSKSIINNRVIKALNIFKAATAPPQVLQYNNYQRIKLIIICPSENNRAERNKNGEYSRMN